MAFASCEERPKLSGVVERGLKEIKTFLEKHQRDAFGGENIGPGRHVTFAQRFGVEDLEQAEKRSGSGGG